MKRRLTGLLKMVFHLIWPRVRGVLDEIVEELLSESDYPRGDRFVLMLGFSLSGKRDFVRKHPQLGRFFVVSSTKIHDLLNSRLEFMKDDNTVTGKAYWERQYLTRLLRKRILRKAFKRGFNVVNVSANLVRREREGRLRIARKYGYRTYIIWLNVSEPYLLKKLLDADIDSVVSKGKAVWLDLYHLVQRARFQAPSEDEADDLMVVGEHTFLFEVIL